MSEPWGCIVEVKITEAALKKYLRCKQKNIVLQDSFYPSPLQQFDNQSLPASINQSKSVACFYASQLYALTNSDPANDVVLFHYDESKQCVFIAIIYDEDVFPIYSPTILSLLAQLAEYKDIDSDDIALFMSPWTGELYAAYHIGKGCLNMLDGLKVDDRIVDIQINQFLSFMEKGFFPPITKALRKRNYYYKPIKNAYNKYCKEQEEIEKPNKISKATKDNPYPLFGYFYSFNNKVYEHQDDDYIELEGADPVTLREVLMFNLCADKQHVYLGYLGFNYHRLEGIDGATFTQCGTGEPIYWKDKNHVYLDRIEREKKLIKLDYIDAKTFKATNGFGFGRDKNNVYIRDKILPVDVNLARLTINGFVFDDDFVYYYSNPVKLDGKTFKVLRIKNATNPFIGPFIVADKTGLYRYDNESKDNSLEKLQDLSPEDLAKIAQLKKCEINF